MRRVFVRLQENRKMLVPKFGDCLVDYFSKNHVDVDVSYQLNDENFDIFPAHEGAKNKIKLQHSAECPVKVDSESEVSVLDVEFRSRNIPVAVSVILESSDNRMLLTRRSKHMRTSPRVWVPPGGHLDAGETLIQCGNREVMEETGLDLSQCDINILCLWESVYPILLGFSPPTSHVLVVYCHAKMPHTYQELSSKMKCDLTEVEAYTWLSAEAVAALFQKDAVKIPMKKYLLQKDGQVVETDLVYTAMFSRQLYTSGKTYSGVQCVLKLWHEMNLKKVKSKI